MAINSFTPFELSEPGRKNDWRRAGLLAGITVLLSVFLGASIVGGWVSYGFGALVAATWIIVAVDRPEFAIATLLLLTSSFISQDNLPSLRLGGTFRPTDLMLGFALILVFLKPAVNRGYDLVHTPLDLPLLLWVGAAVLASYTAGSSGVSFVSAIPEARNLMYYLAFFAVTHLVRDERSLNWLVKTLFVLAFITSLALIAQAIVGPSVRLIPGFVYQVNVGTELFADVSRVEAPGSILILILTVGAIAVWMMKRVPISSPLYVAVLTILLVATILPFYRSIWISLLIPTGIVFLLLPKAGKARITATALVLVPLLVILIGTVSSVVPRIGAYTRALVARSSSLTTGSAFTNNADTWQSRLGEVQSALNVISSHPLFGVGFAVPWRVADRFYGDVGTFTHNGYLWILVKMGLAGMLPFVLLMGLYIVRGLRQWKRVRHPFYQPLALGFTLAFIGLLVGNLAEPRFVENWKWTTAIAAVMGINEVIYRLYASDPEENLSQESASE